jgi:hypothetical protein
LQAKKGEFNNGYFHSIEQMNYVFTSYLVVVVVFNFTIVTNLQILDVNPEDEAEEDGANVDLDSQRKGKCVVLKTSTRQVSVTDLFRMF